MMTGRQSRAARGGILVALALLLPWSAAAASASGAGPLELSYDLFASGLPALTLSFRVELEPDAYRITGSVKGAGLVGLVARYTLESETAGALAGDRLEPRTHAMTSRSRLRQRSARLTYAADGSVAAAVEPPDDPARRPPAPPEVHGTLDPLTAILAWSRGVASRGRCDDRLAVFDGRRRYDLVARDEGTERLPPWPAAPRGMEARRCAIDLVKLAGFSSDPAAPEHLDHGRVWLAPPQPGAPPLPVRLTFSSDWGPITIRLGTPPAG